MIMKSENIQVADIYAAKRLKMSREDRQVDGLIGILRKIADDLEKGSAIESDFDIKVEEGLNLDAIDLTLTSFHLKSKDQPKPLKKIIS